MLLTGGGAFVWWFADAFSIGRMVAAWNLEQGRREAAGEPPLGLDFLPPLARLGEATEPAWAQRWRARGSAWRVLRLAGDVLVVVIAGTMLGYLVGTDGADEAVVAVLLVAATTALGAGPDWLDDVPLAGTLMRWSHRLRLFYHYNQPGSPPALLLRSMIGIMWAPFRTKDRAEVKLYVELGAAFTGLFLLLDLVPALVLPLFSGGGLELGSLLTGWIQEVFATFFLVCAFTAPIGAVLTLYLLVRPTHVLPRALAALTVVSLLAGAWPW
jgi:hypothetical protein